MTISEYLDFGLRARGYRPHWARRGQFAFNCLFRWHPDIANAIVGTDADPFFDDRKLNRFFMTLWEQHVTRPNG